MTQSIQPQQIIEVSGSAASSLLVEGGVNMVKVTAPLVEPLTLYRPIDIITWSAIEKPDLTQEQFDWGKPEIYISSSVSYYQWRNPTNFNDYIRITFAPHTIAEHYIGGIYQNDWYRLSKPDGSTIAAKTQMQYTNQVFALIEMWAYSGGNANCPTTPANFYLPIPIAVNEQSIIPAIWTQYLERKQFEASLPGKSIAPLESTVKQLKTDNAAQDTAIAQLNTALTTATTPNLADLSLGTIDPTSADSARYFIPNRAGARIKEIVFNFRDRRTSTFPSRIAIGVNVTGSQMSGAGGNGWTFSWENTCRYTVAKNFTLDGITFQAAIQWVVCPSGITLWFQEFHSNTWNTYGRFENTIVKWEKSS